LLASHTAADDVITYKTGSQAVTASIVQMKIFGVFTTFMMCTGTDISEKRAASIFTVRETTEEIWAMKLDHLYRQT
jgi:hypothetical protein